MESFKKYWENPKFRMAVVCIVASPLIWFLFTTMFQSRNYVPLAERIEKQQQEDRVDAKGRVQGLFDTGELLELEADEFKEIYNVITKDIQIILSKWKITCEEYLLDTKDSSYRKYLFINGTNKSIVLEFGNYVH